MDRGTLKAFKFYMNFGYSLGFSPYKFVTIPAEHQQKHQQQQTIQLQNPPPDDSDNDAEEDREDEHGRFSVIKKMRKWLCKRNSDSKKRAKKGIGNLDLEKDQEEQWKFEGGSRGKSSWWLLLFSIGLQITYQIFLIFQCIEVFLDKEQTPKEKLKIFYLSGVLFILSFPQILLVLNFGELHVYLNAVKTTVACIKNLREKELKSQFQFQGPGNSGTASKPKSKSLVLSFCAGVVYLQHLLFSSLAEIYTASECVIDSWKRNASLLVRGIPVSGGISNGSWFKKFRESVRPLRIFVGNFFYVDKRFMLTLMAITITQTVNLLLLQ